MKGGKKVKITQNPIIRVINIVTIIFWCLTFYELENTFNCHSLAGPNFKMVTATFMLNSFLLINTKLSFGCDHLHLSGIFIYKDLSHLGGSVS